jgi:predicted dehydrogenase
MKTICVIGAGQLGSRHLQALKLVNAKLNIYVIDTNNESLEVAKERYDSIEEGKFINEISFLKSIKDLPTNEVEIAIVATNSNVRRNVVSDLLDVAKVNYFILEKLLFQNKEDYFDIKEKLDKSGTKTFVNCSMRSMSFYNEIKKELKNKKIVYNVSGSQYGLVTNLIHYIDHLAYLSDCSEYIADTRFLDKKLIPSSRSGYSEVDGTYFAHLNNGSIGSFTCHPGGESPMVIQFYNEDLHCISKESEGKVLLSKASNNWQWEEVDFSIPYQSELTKNLVEDIFETGTCQLVGYDESMRLHLTLLDSLKEFLDTNFEEKFEHYPFT